MTRTIFFAFFLYMFVLRIEPPPALDPPSAGPRVLETEAVTPALAQVAGVNVQAANNNLDVTSFAGRTYLAFRTAPTHFASRKAELVVVSSTDQKSWRQEITVAMKSDVREPRLLAWDGKLFLYFAQLGTNFLRFEPRRMMAMERQADGRWSEAREIYRPGYIPWRTRVVDGRPYMIAYGDGRHIYDRDGVPMQVHWLTTTDGWTWTPVVSGQAAVLEGGGSEADFVDLPGGGLVAVIRNEAGDAGGWGSKICRAAADRPGHWQCRNDGRKFDSPLLFREGGELYLVARRHLSHSGSYDLGQRWLPAAMQTAAYQLDYWRYPKRCALWRVDPKDLAVTWQADLPSRGDTCFPAVTPAGKDTVAIYNYSSPLDGPDLPWVAGQLGRTLIYRSVVRLHPAPALSQR
jgi:hypothetical protein